VSCRFDGELFDLLELVRKDTFKLCDIKGVFLFVILIS